jgi:hypothetical protein
VREKPDVKRLEVEHRTFAIPEDAGHRIVLARLLYPTTWSFQQPLLIWTTGWSVWPSGEHMPLFLRIRQALGDGRSLDEANAQIVDGDSSEDGESIVILHALFLWDCWVLTERADYAVFLSHDEWGEVYFRSAGACDGLLQELARLDLLTG